MAETNKVLFAEVPTTVHVKLSDDPVKNPLTNEETFAVESRVLAPGQYVPVEKVAPYVLEHAKQGKAAGLVVMTETKAKEVAEKAALLRTAAGEGVSETASIQLANNAGE